MKRILALALAAAMALALVACGGGGSSSKSAATSGGGAASSGGGSAASGSAASGSAAGSSSGTSDGSAFKLGGIGPLTGENAQYGMAAMNGAKIAVDEINALGDIQLSFQSEDDVGVAETAVNAYNTLKDWGMQILVGPVTTGPAISVSAEAATDRIFCLTPSASSADVTAGKDNMFQMCFTDPNQGISAADYMAENMAGSKIAVIYRNDDAYSQGIRDTFVAECAEKNLEVVSEGTFTADTQTDFSVQVADAQAKGADVVFLPIYYTPASVILKQANDIGYAPTFFGVDGMDGILGQEGFDTSLAEGVMLLTPFAATLTDDLTVSFVTKYEDQFGQTPKQFAADGYDCVYAIYNALKECDVTPESSPEEICTALIAKFTDSSFKFTGLTGKDMTWSTNGEIAKAPMAFVIKDGVYVLPE